jgi:hypothetical protein
LLTVGNAFYLLLVVALKERPEHKLLVLSLIVAKRQIYIVAKRLFKLSLNTCSNTIQFHYQNAEQ